MNLRTPLTRMKLALELLRDDPAAEELKSDVVEMERMIHDYLDFARGEGTETPVETDVLAAARGLGPPRFDARERRCRFPFRPNT